VNKRQYLWAAGLGLDKSSEVAFRTRHWEKRHLNHQKIKCVVILNRLSGRVASAEAASRRLSEAAGRN
jgi:hypothetical protein